MPASTLKGIDLNHSIIFERFTQDFAVIEIDTSKIDAEGKHEIARAAALLVA